MYFSQNGQYLPPKEGAQTSGAASATGFNENATISFEPGKTYRLRIVNSGAFAGFYFWIDDHEMRIIEADGVETEPYTVNQINIGVAQRYSVLVTAKNDTSSNYAIHAHFDTDMFDTVPDDLNPSTCSGKLGVHTNTHDSSQTQRRTLSTMPMLRPWKVTSTNTSPCPTSSSCRSR